jgi:uncharacterized protein (TIGR00255 family)
MFPAFSPAVVAGALEVDAELLTSLTRRAQAMAAEAGPAARIAVLDLLRWPGVIRDATRDPAPMLAAAHALLADALAELTRFRDSEGGRLLDALEQRCAGLIEFAARVTDRLPEVRARMRTRLLERIAQLVSDVDHERLEQELAILAQRLDVDEEIDRLRGHVAEVRKTFDGQSRGRRLDFLMQELNREANTLSSKSQDIETTPRGGRYEGSDRADARGASRIVEQIDRCNAADSRGLFAPPARARRVR